jgi:general stress protein YciG
MEFREVEKKLNQHDEELKRIKDALLALKNVILDEVDPLLESKGDSEYEDRPQQRTGSSSWGSGQRRGFAAMDPEKRSEIARKGGAASHSRQGQSRNSGEKELEAMEQFLRERGDELNETGRREVEEAIEKRRDELEARH